MDYDVVVEMERIDVATVSWWASSEQIDRFTAAANSLQELKELVRETIADIDPAHGVIRFTLNTSKVSEASPMNGHYLVIRPRVDVATVAQPVPARHHNAKVDFQQLDGELSVAV